MKVALNEVSRFMTETIAYYKKLNEDKHDFVRESQLCYFKAVQGKLGQILPLANFYSNADFFQTFISRGALMHCINFFTKVARAVHPEDTSSTYMGALVGMLRAVVQAFPVPVGGPDVESQPATQTSGAAFRTMNVESSQKLIDSLLKALLDEYLSKQVEEAGLTDDLIRLIVMTFEYTVGNLVSTYPIAELFELFIKFYDWLADETGKFHGSSTPIEERGKPERPVVSSDANDAVSARKETLHEAHVKLLHMLKEHNEVISNVKDLITNGEAPYIKGLFWSLAVVDSNKHKEMAADLLAVLGLLCMQSASNGGTHGHKKPIEVFRDEGESKTLELWKMLARHGSDDDPSADSDRGKAVMIVLSTVIVATDKLKYHDIVHDKWSPDAKQDVKKQGPQILEFLLSRVLEYKLQPWLLYISGTLAITLLHCFFFHKSARKPPKCSFRFRTVLQASHALMSSNKEVFMCMGATLYMIFHSSCHTNKEHWPTKKGGISAVEHLKYLNQALDILYYACNDPPKEFFKGEWNLKINKWSIEVHCSVKDKSPTWLARVYRKAAVHEFHFLFNAVTFFALTFDTRELCDTHPKAVYEEQHNRKHLVSVLTNALQSSCKSDTLVNKEGIDKNEKYTLIEEKLGKWIASVLKDHESDTAVSILEVVTSSVQMASTYYHDREPWSSPQNLNAEGKLPVPEAQLLPSSNYPRSPFEVKGSFFDPEPSNKAARGELARESSRSSTELRAGDVAVDVDVEAQLPAQQTSESVVRARALISALYRIAAGLDALQHYMRRELRRLRERLLDWLLVLLVGRVLANWLQGL